MESTKTFVEHPSGKLAVTVHAPRSLREEEAAYFHGINLEQAHKFAHLNGWQLTVDRETILFQRRMLIPSRSAMPQ